MTGTLPSDQAPALTSADRCDRCGARAYIRAVLPSGGELLFCAHHGRLLEPSLRAREVRLLDETGQLTAPV